MISYHQALESVLARKADFGVEQVSLELANGRVLAEDVLADRDQPPYNRATMDGIALAYHTYEKGVREFPSEGMARAGITQLKLQDPSNCIEIATGAILPEGADTIVRYEDLEEIPEGFRILAGCTPNKNIHRKGSDASEGAVLLKKGHSIDPSAVAVLASVGKATLAVRGLPGITILSTGDELVPVETIPETHQVRRSNVHALRSAVLAAGIRPDLEHLPDDAAIIENRLEALLQTQDVLLLSGGVSKGKFDHLPGVLEKLGVVKDFHRVAQRPGKPFWFGMDAARGCHVFSFPGNPVSTFLNYHLYFLPWLRQTTGAPEPRITAILEEPIENKSDLTHFIPLRLSPEQGHLNAVRISMNGSGDYLSLTKANAFGRVNPGEVLVKGALVPCICFNLQL
ncbi:molybdopterin molybdochelatase [Robiginitalea myxolifaciens]|uniref:Molybdopterin molybdenumtransferase n=1 Tax=Robiginitalea myxolifaciens TaxID=400055 RepID=A0A1I6GXV7_9FLAO|nr:molybdopterin molybdotransferase MoeA [Robiginitalea myxolifaciens]SFR47032.1 molybdopterin molybdochelatase [Robiginitalea myxolifaciens]